MSTVQHNCTLLNNWREIWRNVLKDKCLPHLFQIYNKKENTFIINDFLYTIPSQSRNIKKEPPFFLAEDMYTIPKLQFSL